MQITITLPNATDIMTKGDYTKLRPIFSRYEAEAEATKDAEALASEIEASWLGRANRKSRKRKNTAHKNTYRIKTEKALDSNKSDERTKRSLEGKYTFVKKKNNREMYFVESEPAKGQVYKKDRPFSNNFSPAKAKRNEHKRSRQAARNQINSYTNADELALEFLKEIADVAMLLGQEVGELYE